MMNVLVVGWFVGEYIGELEWEAERCWWMFDEVKSET